MHYGTSTMLSATLLLLNHSVLMELYTVSTQLSILVILKFVGTFYLLN